MSSRGAGYPVRVHSFLADQRKEYGLLGVKPLGLVYVVPATRAVVEMEHVHDVHSASANLTWRLRNAVVIE